jgi:hypothetical protein
MKIQAIRAIHDDDLENFLKGLGINRDFKNGKLSCAYCKETITIDNLHSFFPDSGSIKICCSKPNCVQELFSTREAIKK